MAAFNYVAIRPREDTERREEAPSLRESDREFLSGMAQRMYSAGGEALDGNRGGRVGYERNEIHIQDYKELSPKGGDDHVLAGAERSIAYS